MIGIILAGCLIATIIVSLILIVRHSGESPASPFTAKTLAANNFSLYYPTRLPSGYSIDDASVSAPESGVVVYTIKSKTGKKIYISEQARPAAFDFGGYYKKFHGLTEHIMTSGTIATGYIDDGQTAVGSLVIGKTWVFVNTPANTVPLSSLADVLGGLAVSH